MEEHEQPLQKDGTVDVEELLESATTPRGSQGNAPDNGTTECSSALASTHKDPKTGDVFRAVATRHRRDEASGDIEVDLKIIDQKGRFVRGLTKPPKGVCVKWEVDPSVLSGCNVKVVDKQLVEEDASRMFALAVDYSGSVHQHRDALTNKVEQVRRDVGSSSFVLVAFGKADVPFALYSEPSRVQAINTDYLRRGGGGQTPFYDALGLAIDAVERQSKGKSRRRATIVTYTDGIDNASVLTSDDVVRIARSAGVSVTVVGIGGAAAGSLQDLAISTGGNYYYYSGDVSAGNFIGDGRMDEVLLDARRGQGAYYQVTVRASGQCSDLGSLTVWITVSDCKEKQIEAGSTRSVPVLDGQPHGWKPIKLFFDFDVHDDPQLDPQLDPSSDRFASVDDMLGRVVWYLRNFSSSSVRLTGLTDTSGPKGYNRRLSRRRATHVRDLLVAKLESVEANDRVTGLAQVNQSRIVDSGRGEGPGPDRVKDRKNRHTDIVLSW